MKMTYHIVSDLFLIHTENSDQEHQIPDVDIVFINGNIGLSTERTLLYASTLCKKYPTTQFLYNPGFTEIYTPGHLPRNNGDTRDILELTQRYNKDWPVNLHYNYGVGKIITLRNGYSIDCMSLFGFPYILKAEISWEKTIWFKHIIMEITDNWLDPRFKKPVDTSNVKHGNCPIWATKEWINEQHKFEWDIARRWEISQSGHFKVLSTHLNPYNDKRYQGQIVMPYDIHLMDGLWVCGGDDVKVNFVGATLVSNPGRGLERRSQIFTMNS